MKSIKPQNITKKKKNVGYIHKVRHLGDVMCTYCCTARFSLLLLYCSTFVQTRRRRHKIKPKQVEAVAASAAPAPEAAVTRGRRQNGIKEALQGGGEGGRLSTPPDKVWDGEYGI